MLLVLNLPLVGIWVKVLAIPRATALRRDPGVRDAGRLQPAPVAGSTSLTLYVFGLLGFAMRRWDSRSAPVIVGLILGPLAETQMRRALAISQGDPSVFVTQPISAALLALAVGAIVGPWIWRRLKRA